MGFYEYEARQARVYTPEPPLGMTERWLLWVSDSHRVTGDLGSHAAYMLAGLRAFPRWPQEVSQAQRRAVITPKLLKALEAWDQRSSLVILGGTDRGKTTATYEAAIMTVQTAVRAYLNSLTKTVSRWPLPYFVKALDLAQAWRGTKLGDEVDPEIVRQAKTAELLVIDDIGQEPNDPQRALWAVADHRYDVRRPTLVTSGLHLEGPGGLLERYSEAFLRRLVDACGKDSGKVVNLWAPDASKK